MPILKFIRRKIYWLPLAVLAVITGCTKENTPVACFNITSNAPFVYQTVYFSNCSLRVDSVVYSFGDGLTSDSLNPQHTYTAPGNYNVNLTAYHNGNSNSIAKNIIVSEPFPYDSFVGVYHFTGYSQYLEMGHVSFTDSIDTSYAITDAGSNALYLNDSYYATYYLQTQIS